MRIEVRCRPEARDFAVFVNDEFIEGGFSDSAAALQHARELASELLFAKRHAG